MLSSTGHIKCIDFGTALVYTDNLIPKGVVDKIMNFRD